jgi:hypothetical protein
MGWVLAGSFWEVPALIAVDPDPIGTVPFAAWAPICGATTSILVAGKQAGHAN